MCGAVALEAVCRGEWVDWCRVGLSSSYGVDINAILNLQTGIAKLLPLCCLCKAGSWVKVGGGADVRGHATGRPKPQLVPKVWLQPNVSRSPLKGNVSF